MAHPVFRPSSIETWPCWPDMAMAWIGIEIQGIKRQTCPQSRITKFETRSVINLHVSLRPAHPGRFCVLVCANVTLGETPRCPPKCTHGDFAVPSIQSGGRGLEATRRICKSCGPVELWTGRTGGGSHWITGSLWKTKDEGCRIQAGRRCSAKETNLQRQGGVVSSRSCSS